MCNVWVELASDMRRLGWLPPGPTLRPSLLRGSFLPPPPQSAKGWSPELTQGASRRGRTFSCKSWSKDLITWSTLVEPLGLSDVNPLEGNVYSCVHRSTPVQAPPPPCAPGPLPSSPTGKGRQFNGSLSQTAPRRSDCSWMDPGYGATGQRKRFGITGPSV